MEAGEVAVGAVEGVAGEHPASEVPAIPDFFLDSVVEAASAGDAAPVAKPNAIHQPSSP